MENRAFDKSTDLLLKALVLISRNPPQPSIKRMLFHGFEHRLH
jgi:hypothetical protein